MTNASHTLDLEMDSNGSSRCSVVQAGTWLTGAPFYSRQLNSGVSLSPCPESNRILLGTNQVHHHLCFKGLLILSKRDSSR